MLSYLMAIHFVLFGDSTNLKNFWKYEVIRRKRMDIWRLLREKKQRNRNFLSGGGWLTKCILMVINYIRKQPKS